MLDLQGIKKSTRETLEILLVVLSIVAWIIPALIAFILSLICLAIKEFYLLLQERKQLRRSKKTKHKKGGDYV